MAPKTLPKPPIDADLIPGVKLTPIWQRWFLDHYSVLKTNQAATDATALAAAPLPVAPSPSGTTTIYRPTTSLGSGYTAATNAYDGNAATPATAIIRDVQMLSRT